MRVLFWLFPALALGTYYKVPSPNGTYGVSIQDIVLTDDQFPDPFLNRSSRRLLASIIAPTGPRSACTPALQPYMPLPTAQFWEQALHELLPWNFNGTLSETLLQLCASGSTFTTTREPVILFAPGAGVARQFYHILMSNFVAQTGYTVITYEQPGRTEFVWFPDGEVERIQRNFTPGEPVPLLVQDGELILNWYNISKAAMWGHSEGGEVASGVVVQDDRVLGGIDLDGGFYSNVTSLNHTTTKPFALFAHTGHYQNNSLTPWWKVWENSEGDKWQLQLNESTHYTFSDAPYLVRDLYDLAKEYNESQVTAAIGAIPGTTAIEVISAMGGAFFDFVFGRAPASGVVQTANKLEWFTVENVTIV